MAETPISISVRLPSERVAILDIEGDVSSFAECRRAALALMDAEDLLDDRHRRSGRVDAGAGLLNFTEMDVHEQFSAETDGDTTVRASVCWSRCSCGSSVAINNSAGLSARDPPRRSLPSDLRAHEAQRGDPRPRRRSSRIGRDAMSREEGQWADRCGRCFGYPVDRLGNRERRPPSTAKVSRPMP